ncbi:MAG: SAM-dependent methyltransferase [Bacteroidetes bacterium]|nr:SAM-dependent methyltransferase [Bacteroidota bacterium]
MDKMNGKLYLLPSAIGDSDIDLVIPVRNREIMLQLSEFVVEEERTARRFLRRIGYMRDFETVRFYIYNEHSEEGDIRPVIDSLLSGNDIGLLSEAGAPCVADPGAGIVREAHLSGIRVVPLTGPSSIILALMASGFNGQNFVFHGYLPVNKNERLRSLKELEKKVYKDSQTQIFIEAPYRNMVMFESVIEVCASETMLCIACDLTTDAEFIRTLSISEWKKDRPEINKRPAVFLIYK